MKSLLLGMFSLLLLSCQSSTQEKVTLKTQQDSISYSIGANIGHNLKEQGIEVNPTIVAQGMRDVLDSTKALMSDSQCQSTMTAFQSSMRTKQEEKMKAAGESAKKDGENFLAENKKKEGVMTTASGLQYKVLTPGTGKKPTADQTVTVHYKGTLVNGTEFDNSYKRGEPISFPLNGVIKGWTEGVQLMPVGSKYQFVIPSELGYGERGGGQLIPPNSVLIFEVELIGIK